MCGNGLEIQEIKRRLAANGQDIDEDVISDFLENCDFVGITDKISHIIRIISEKDDFQNSLDIMGTSSSSESHYASDSTSEYSSSMESTNVKVIDISSDSDDDTDYYHHNTSNMNDTSVIDTLKIAANDITTSCSYLQPNDNKSLLNQDVDVVTDVAVDVVTDGDSQVTTANSKTQVSEVSIPEITILEEKNDITCIKSTSKVPKATILEENNNDVAYVKSIFKMEDPKPGCSKDPDAPALPPVLEDLCSFSVSDELQKDARIIHALLPNFNYSLIYRTLCNNQFAKNCIELTLWDLLPEKRPAIQPLNKRKCSNEICPIQCKKSLKTSVHKDQMDTKATLKEKPVRAKRKEIIDIKSRNKEFASDGTDEMETNVFAKVTPLNIDNNTDQSIVPVRKTKLNYTSNIPNKNIEFSYDINPIHSKLLKDIDDMESTKIREPLEIKSIFSDDALGSSTASSEMFNIDNFLEAFLEPPIEDVSDPFLQVKRKDLGEKAQARTETRVVDVKSENKESTLMTDKTDEIKNKNIWEEKILNNTNINNINQQNTVQLRKAKLQLPSLMYLTECSSNFNPNSAYAMQYLQKPLSEVDGLKTEKLQSVNNSGVSSVSSVFDTVWPSKLEPLFNLGTLKERSLGNVSLATEKEQTMRSKPRVVKVKSRGSFTQPVEANEVRRLYENKKNLWKEDSNNMNNKFISNNQNPVVSRYEDNMAYRNFMEPMPFNYINSNAKELRIPFKNSQTLKEESNIISNKQKLKFVQAEMTGEWQKMLKRQKRQILMPSKLQVAKDTAQRSAKTVVVLPAGKTATATATAMKAMTAGAPKIAYKLPTEISPSVLSSDKEASNSNRISQPTSLCVNPDAAISQNKTLSEETNVKIDNIPITKVSSTPLYTRPSTSTATVQIAPECPTPGSSKDYHPEMDGTNLPQICERGDKAQKNSSLVDVEKNASKVMIKENNGDLKPLHVITLHEKASQIYAKLIPMFPDVKASFIKALCFKGIQPDDLRDEAILLELLVDALLNYNKKNLLIKNVEPAATVKNSNETLKTPDLNEQYADLLMIFPEADPVYLREIAEQMYKNPEQIKEFVQSKLENPDYPTRAQYLAKKKLTEQQKQYTTDFQVQQFLELFPDPFSYFEDEKRKCQFNPHAVDFLKHYFSKLKVNTLVNTYSQYVHNLSLTAKALEALNPDLKTKRYSSKTILTEDIPFLQECAFIQHKAELRKYLDEMKAKEEQEFNELKAKNELLECQCCYDNECMPSKCSTCAEGHIFCNSCIIRSTDIVLADGNTHVKCLLNCGCDFPISVLQKILSPTKFSILLCKQQEAEVMAAGVEGLVSCPFCHFASIPPPEDKIFKCLNPECMKESCRLCKEINHIPLKCNEKKSEAARLYLEEKMTEALVRKCYRCNRMFFKEEGCNKMTCLCGAKMCYICDKPVTDYRHFQGQGATGSNLCPLWSDNRRLNAESVIKVCKETMKQIKEKDPKVDINIERLLPKLPPKSKGPHEDIPQFNRMMEHADRIARHIP